MLWVGRAPPAGTVRGCPSAPQGRRWRSSVFGRLPDATPGRFRHAAAPAAALEPSARGPGVLEPVLRSGRGGG
eukprot:8189212-Pyramimonas_sp.AAC.1